jgi:hypothetical protein
MINNTRTWLAVASGAAVGLAAVVVSTSTDASAQPLPPPPPAPVTVTQTVPAAPAAAPVAGLPQLVPGQAAGVPQLGPGEAAVMPQLGPGQAASAAQLAPSQVVRSESLPLQPVRAPAAIPAPSLVPATSGTLREYFASKNVQLEPQQAQGFTALRITLPMPPGWAQVPDPNVPDAFLVIADRVGGDGLYTNNAQLVVYRLVGDFDPNEAITHGFIDSTKLFAWQTTDASMGEFHGLPSSIIEGTYRENDMTLNTSRRHVIAPAGPDKYLLTLSVTTPASQVVATGNATDAIINGFRVVPATPPPSGTE